MANAPNDPEMLALRRAQLKGYSRNLTLNALVTAFAALLCAALVSRHVPLGIVLPWVGVQLALSAWSIRAALRRRRRVAGASEAARPWTAEDIRRSELLALAAAAISGSLWGGSALFVFILPLELAFSQLLVLAAMAAGAATTMAALPNCSRIFSAACLLPAVPVLLLDSRVNSGTLAALALLMLVAILAATRQVNRRMIEQLHSERMQRQLLLKTQEERVRAEAALEEAKRRADLEAAARRDAQAQTKTMFENMAIGMFRVTPKGKLVRANPALVRLLECRDEAEACAIEFGERGVYVEPDRRAKLVSLLEADGKVTNFVSEIRHPVSGRRLWVAESLWPVRDHTGAVAYYEGIVDDVSDQVETQRALEASQVAIRAAQERYELAVDGTGIGVWSWDLRRDRFERTRQCQVLLGHDGADAQKELKSAELVKLVHFADRSLLKAARRAAIRTGELEVTVRFRCRDQSFRWFRLKGKAVRDEKGRVVRVAGSMQDVDELVRKEQEIGTAMTRAQETARARAAFLAMMSHEIRTPMNGVIGMTRLLLDTELRPDQHHMASVIRESADSLLRIVNDILDLSKLDSGRAHLEAAPFDLMPMLNYTLEIVAPRAKAKQLNLALRCSRKGPLYVRGDAGRLRQVLLNLLGNAIKFTEVGSVELAVTVAQSAGDALRLGFAVTDTGIGIPKETLPKLFQDFVQADSGISRKYGGTGLGLAISRRLVARMGGEINVVSTENVGSTFYFHIELPAASAADVLQPVSHVDVEDARTRLLAAVRPIRILVAEDNKTNQLVIRRMLAEFPTVGLDVVETGAAAVEAVRAGRFDLALMDVHMPVMDGIEATQAIRMLGTPQARLPIVAITAHAFAEDIARCRAAGMNGHLAKPFRRGDLLKAVASFAFSGAPAAGGAAPAATAAAAPPPCDFSRAVLEQLGAEIGEDGIADLVRVFLEQSRGLIAGAKAQSGKSGRDELVRAVHSIKSSAASVGAMALSALAAEMERQLKLGGASPAPGDFAKLDGALDAFKAAYEAAHPAAPARPLIAA